MDDRVEIGLPEGPRLRFTLVRVPALVLRRAAEIADRQRHASTDRLLVVYQRASRDAREALRAAEISYIGEDGSVYLRAPGVLVEHSEPKRSLPVGAVPPSGDGDAVRNPFAKRSSRVARWLLLHPTRAFSLAELAADVDLNAAAVSRVVRALEEAGHVEASTAGVGRRKQVRLHSAGALLDSWHASWQARRVVQRRWDVGARDPDGAITLVSEALVSHPHSWALGGLSGAALVKRIVEPAEAVVWTTAEGLAGLEEMLLPAPARGGRGVLRLAVAPDPWTLSLARDLDGRPVADLVQLWLDCSSSGERALEAADAVASAAGWA